MTPSLTDAHEKLRAIQNAAHLRTGLEAQFKEVDTTIAALGRAELRETSSVIEGDIIRDYAFKYDTKVERERWRRTRQILARTQPGPHEDPIEVEMVARQAASIEMILNRYANERQYPKLKDLTERVLVGTVPTPKPIANSRRSGKNFFILISIGLIEFVYQVTKATVLSWKLTGSPNSRRSSFSDSLDDVEEVLATNPMPKNILLFALKSFIFHGMPSGFGRFNIPKVYFLPLNWITNCNQRFLLAHEYSHMMFDELDLVFDVSNRNHVEEHLADMFGLKLLMNSAEELDNVAPNIACQGAFLTLGAVEILQEALCMAMPARSESADNKSSHPIESSRIDLLSKHYTEEVGRHHDMLAITPAIFPAQTLRLVWANTKAEFEDIVDKQDFTPHEIWKGH